MVQKYFLSAKWKDVSYNLRDASESMWFQYECVSEHIRKDALAYQGVQLGYCFDKRNKDKKKGFWNLLQQIMGVNRSLRWLSWKPFDDLHLRWL